MLWIEYESSEFVTKDLVRDVLVNVNNLLYPTPIAAEDQRADGFGIFAYDGYLSCSDSDDIEDLAGKETNVAETTFIPDASEAAESLDILFDTNISEDTNPENYDSATFSDDSSVSSEPAENREEKMDLQGEQSRGHSSRKDHSQPGTGNDSKEHQEANGEQKANGNAESSGNESSRSSGNTNGSNDPSGTQAGSAASTKGTSREVPATFIGRLDIETPAGYTQRLQVDFEPVVIADTNPLSRVENTMRMNTVNVRAHKMTAPATATKGKDKSELDPYFVNEITTITVGAACEHDGVEGPIEVSPIENDFITGRTASNQTTKGGSVTVGYPLIGKLLWFWRRTDGMSEALTARTIGLEPWFGASAVRCQSWKYRVKNSYQKRLEFSPQYPPLHSAKFWYDGRLDDNFPKHLMARVETDFTKDKGFRHPVAKLGFRKTFRRLYIRHISLSLEARIKRIKPEDYFRIPGLGREGATLKATVRFCDGKTTDETLRKETRNIGEDTDLTPKLHKRNGGLKRS
jgi:hypothetical protein